MLLASWWTGWLLVWARPAPIAPWVLGEVYFCVAGFQHGVAVRISRGLLKFETAALPTAASKSAVASASSRPETCLHPALARTRAQLVTSRLHGPGAVAWGL